MINKGKIFEKDIRELKALSSKRKKNNAKYGEEYLNLKEVIAQKYDVSIRTVERWVKARTPWARDKRDDAGKIRTKVPRKITKYINETLETGLTKKAAKETVEKISGQKLSNRVFDREAKKEISSEVTGFGSEAKEFFKKLFEIDLIPPEKGLKLRYKNTSFIVTKPDLEDVCRVLANAYNRTVDQKSQLPVNRASLRRSKLWHMFDEALTLINERGVNVTDLKEVSLFTQRLEIDRNKINPRVTTIWKIVQVYNPDVTLDEVISLAEELEGVYD